MDWLRRNWPDLIIAVALVAVIAMIVATLLGGSPLFSFGGRGGDVGGRPAEPPAAQGSQNSGQDAGQNSESPAGANNNAQQAGIEPVVPDLPNEGASAPENADDAQANGQTPAQDAGQVADGATEVSDDPVASDPAPADGSAASGTGEPTAEPIEGVSYRVSVGAFASREGAQSLTKRYSNEGLPTFVASQGDLSLALVGPYATEGEANRVAQQIIQDGGEALVYSYESDGAEENSGDTAASDAAADQDQSDATSEVASQEEGAAVDTSTTDTDTNSVAQTSGTFLQAGAFGSSDSAQTRRERIQELGYATSEREATTGLVRLFVGPFGPDEIEEAQARLQTLGIDSFAVTLP